MVLRAKTTTIDVKDLVQGKDRIEDQGANDRRQEHTARDPVNANATEIERGIEMEGE